VQELLRRSTIRVKLETYIQAVKRSTAQERVIALLFPEKNAGNVSFAWTNSIFLYLSGAFLYSRKNGALSVSS
jgi:hypothetical protein